MAERLKEILANTLHVSDMVVDALPLLTTDGATQYVIQDLVVDTELPASELQVNGHGVAEIPSGKGRLRGREIVDVTSAVKVKMPFSIDDHMTYELGFAGKATGVFYSGDVSTLLDVTVESTAEFNLGASLNSDPDIFWFGSDGNFYYSTHNGNATCYLRRRVGGIGGVENNVHSASYCQKVLEGSKFYWYDSNTELGYHDTTNDTTGTLALTGSITLPAPATYSRACIVNGVFFYISSNGDPDNVYCVDVATGKKGRITSLGQHESLPVGQNEQFCVTYDADTDRYALCVRNSVQEVRIWRLVDALPLDGATDYTVDSDNCVYTEFTPDPVFVVTNYHAKIRPLEGHRLAYLSDDSRLMMLDLVTEVSSELLPSSVFSDHHASWKGFSLAKKADADLSVYDSQYAFAVRATGVEITGVA